MIEQAVSPLSDQIAHHLSVQTVSAATFRSEQDRSRAGLDGIGVWQLKWPN